MKSQLQNFIHQDEPAIKRYFIATRPMFLSASALPVLLGTAIGVHTSGNFDLIAMVLALLSVMLVHAGVNVINDVFDDLNGTDRINSSRISPFTGGSRVIQNNVLTLEQMRRWGITLLILGILTGLALILYSGMVVLILGCLGLLLGIAYSAPPLKLASRGLGESAVAVGFGILPVVGAAWLQSGIISWQALLLALPVSLWITNVLLINEIPDITADQLAGKRTLPVRLELRTTALLYMLGNILAVALLVIAVALDYLQAMSLSLSFLLLLPAVYATRAIILWKQRPSMMEDAIKLTLVIHAVNCLWLISWYISG